MPENKVVYPTFICQRCGHVSLVRFDNCPKCRNGAMVLTTDVSHTAETRKQYDSMMGEIWILAVVGGILITVLVLLGMLMSLF